MSITINLSPADVQFVQEQAIAGNVSIEQFSRDAIMKAARNAAYLAKLEQSRKQIEQGKVVRFTDEEWEKFTNAQDIQ